jgi:hypothetical protein
LEDSESGALNVAVKSLMAGCDVPKTPVEAVYELNHRCAVEAVFSGASTHDGDPLAFSVSIVMPEVFPPRQVSTAMPLTAVAPHTIPPVAVVQGQVAMGSAPPPLKPPLLIFPRVVDVSAKIETCVLLALIEVPLFI